jgi:group I intron endonuclease
VNNHLQNSYNKYGNVFTFEIVESFDKIDSQKLNELEIKYIEQFSSFTDGYNLTKGGGGAVGFAHSEESKLKLSLAKLGKEAWNKGLKNPYISILEIKRKLQSFLELENYLLESLF